MQARPSNVEQQFTVGHTLFDNERGLGAVPLNQEVGYRGAVAWLTPSHFLGLALPGDRAADATALASLIQQGHAIATPWLTIDMEPRPRIVGHEGRARAQAFAKINGNVSMPVQLHFVHRRARDLTPEVLWSLTTEGLLSERGQHTVLSTTRFFWNYKELKMELDASRRRHAVAADPGQGSAQSEPWYPPVEQGQTQQFDMEIAPALHQAELSAGARLLATSQVLSRRTQKWFDKMANSNRAAYCSKYPGTKFLTNHRLKTPGK